MSHIEENAFSHKVVDRLKGTRPVKDIIADVCQLNDGQFAIKICGNACAIYSRDNDENTSIKGYDIIATVCLVINEIDRLSDLGIISVFQVNARETFAIGDSTLINGQTAYNITSEKLVKYLRMDVYGGERLDKYISNGYKTDSEVLAMKNLITAQETLLKTKCSVWVAVIIFLLSAIIDIVLQCCSTLH